MKLFITILILSTKLIATCHDINHFDSSKKLRDLKIVNQGDMSTCYAHSLASLYNHKQQAQEDYLHPYWIAFKHKNKAIHWSPKNMNYSLLSWAWTDMLKKGMCDFNEVSEILRIYKNGVDYSDDQFFYFLKTFFSLKKNKNIQDESIFKNVLDLTLIELRKNSFGFERKWSQKDSESILRPIQMVIGDKRLFDFFKENMFLKCEKSIREPQGELISMGKGIESNEKIFATVSDQLEKDKSLAIGFCSKPTFLQDPRSSRDITSKIRLAKSFSTKCAAHYSLIVGSRNNNNQCEILVRNSYGTDFWAHESMTCYCENPNTKQKFNCSKETSKGQRVLGCWINKDKLFNNTFDISYFY